ncbi:MAG TPA: hypothetical protein PKJ13_00375 [bacterium]|nr:hypothetical protein [bacterium]HPG82206.1 hypothetical protein [bacterium]
MKLHLSLTALALMVMGCSRPQVTPPVRKAVDLGLPGTAALRLTPQQEPRPADLLLLTPPEMPEETVLKFAEKSSQQGFRILWVRSALVADAEAAAVLLQNAALQMESGGKKGVMLFGAWPGAAALLTDTTFRALLWIAAPQETAVPLAAADSSASRPRLALIVPDPAPVTLTPRLKGWLRTSEDLVWLTTAQPAAALLESDLEPIIRRKAQLFFDRHLKGKR